MKARGNVDVPVVSREATGGLIDGVYAITVTLLVLELPGDYTSIEEIKSAVPKVLDYFLAFSVAFGLWVHHRRINLLIERNSSLIVLLHGVTLALSCLMPAALNAVYAVEVGETRNPLWAISRGEVSLAVVVDLWLIGIVISCDLLLMIILILGDRGEKSNGHHALLRLKLVSSTVLLLTLVVAFLFIPHARLALLVLPFWLLLEPSIQRRWITMSEKSIAGDSSAQAHP